MADPTGTPVADQDAAPRKPRKKLVALIITALVVVVLVLAGLGTYFGVRAHADSVAAEAHSRALTACVGQSKALTAAKAAYTEAVASDDVQAALTITGKQVADPQTVDALSEATSFTAFVAGTCDTKLSTVRLTKLGENAEAASKAYTGATGRLPAAVKAVTDSKAQKADTDVLAALDAEVKTASALLDSSNGKTADNTERQALTTEIQSAQKLAKDTGKHATDYTAETAKLKTAEKAVTDAEAAKVAADQAAAAQAQANRGSSGNGFGGGSYSGGSSSGSPTGGSSSGASGLSGNSGRRGTQNPNTVGGCALNGTCDGTTA